MEEMNRSVTLRWCVLCKCFFRPRACNAAKQTHCNRTPECKRAPKNASNRKYRLKRSRDPQWRHANVLRVQRSRRITRDGFDADAVTETLDVFFHNLVELIGLVNEALPLLDSLISLLLPAVLLRKLPCSPATLRTLLEKSRDWTLANSNRAILQLKTIPSLTLRDRDLPRCA